MLSENVLICSKNLADAGIMVPITAVDPSHPLTRAQERPLHTFARTLSRTECSFAVDLRQTQGLKLVSVIKHNLGAFAEWRVRLADTEAQLTSAPSYDSGLVPMSPGFSGFGLDDWGDFLWGGAVTNLYDGQFKRCAYCPFPEKQFARWIRVDIVDDSDGNTRDEDFIQFARFWASDGYQPSLNAAYGSEFIPIDETKTRKSEAGVKEYSLIKVNRRALNLVFEALPKSELFGKLIGPVMASKGKEEELVVLLAPLDSAALLLESIHGTMAELPATSYVYWLRVGTSLYIEEDL